MFARLAKRIAWPLVAAGAPLLVPVGRMALWSYGVAGLKRAGFAPRTVFDIGVARGTPELYAAFPEAHFVLIELTRESLPYMEEIARRLDAEVHSIALGDRDGEMEIQIRHDDIQGATFFKEIGPLGATDRYTVPVRRFDTLFACFERPALCKIDVQGSEIMVLKGMGASIRDFDALIVEASTIATLEAAPEIFEVVAYLKSQSFVIFDLLGMARRPLDGALAQLDLLLVREDSPLRADHRWRALGADADF